MVAAVVSDEAPKICKQSIRILRLIANFTLSDSQIYSSNSSLWNPTLACVEA